MLQWWKCVWAMIVPFWWVLLVKLLFLPPNSISVWVDRYEQINRRRLIKCSSAWDFEPSSDGETSSRILNSRLALFQKASRVECFPKVHFLATCNSSQVKIVPDDIFSEHVRVQMSLPPSGPAWKLIFLFPVRARVNRARFENVVGPALKSTSNLFFLTPTQINNLIVLGNTVPTCDIKHCKSIGMQRFQPVQWPMLGKVLNFTPWIFKFIMLRNQFSCFHPFKKIKNNRGHEEKWPKIFVYRGTADEGWAGQHFQIIWEPDCIHKPTWTLSFMNNIIMHGSLHQ